VRDSGWAGSADRVVRGVVDDTPVHLNAVQPAPDHGGQHEDKDWDERGNAMPR